MSTSHYAKAKFRDQRIAEVPDRGGRVVIESGAGESPVAVCIGIELTTRINENQMWWNLETSRIESLGLLRAHTCLMRSRKCFLFLARKWIRII